MSLLLHLNHPLNYEAWHLEQTIVSGTFIAVTLYFYGSLKLGTSFSFTRAASYLLGVAVMFIALASPIDVAAERLLSMHMLQHVLLTTIGPPLILLGLPPGLFSGLLRGRRPSSLVHLFTHPVFAGALFIVNMWLWHVPPVYDLALESLTVHVAMHLAFMGTGVLFWWPVIQPTPEAGRHGDGARLLYLFAAGMPMALLALLFFASGGVIYDHYETVEPLWGLSPRDDQQIAGLIMGALGEAASFIAITLLFFRFLEQEESAPGSQPAGRVDAG